MPFIEVAVGLGKSITAWLWSWFRSRRAVGREILMRRQMILDTDSSLRLSGHLLELKELFQSNPNLFGKPHLQQFHDTWLLDKLLDIEGKHSELCVFNSPAALARLKSDARKLLRP